MVTSIYLQRSQLLRRALSDQLGNPLGRVEDLWLDLDAHRVQAVIFRTGALGLGQSRVAWQAIQSCEAQIVVAPAPLPDLPDNLPSPLGSPVVDTEGRALGILSDYSFEPGSGAVATYCCTSPTRSEPIQFAPAAIRAARPEGFVIAWSEPALPPSAQPADVRQQIAAEIEQVFAQLRRLEATLEAAKHTPVAARC